MNYIVIISINTIRGSLKSKVVKLLNPISSSFEHAQIINRVTFVQTVWSYLNKDFGLVVFQYNIFAFIVHKGPNKRVTSYEAAFVRLFKPYAVSALNKIRIFNRILPFCVFKCLNEICNNNI